MTNTKYPRNRYHDRNVWASGRNAVPRAAELADDFDIDAYLAGMTGSRKAAPARVAFDLPSLPTPLMALDVDGPLNAYLAAPKALAKAARTPNGFRAVDFASRVTYRRGSTWHPFSRLHLARAHGDMLARFSSAHDVELVWASMWEHNCNTVIGPAIGLPRLPWVDFHSHPVRDLWKFPAMLEFAAGHPLVWLDDSFNDRRKVEQRRRSGFDRARRNLPTLLLHVSPSTGITAEHLAEVADWVKLARLAW